jgi:hypothetical protein
MDALQNAGSEPLNKTEADLIRTELSAIDTSGTGILDGKGTQIYTKYCLA